MRPIARSVGRTAVRQGMRPAALPGAIRQTAARVAAQPALARRLSQTAARTGRAGAPRSRPNIMDNLLDEMVGNPGQPRFEDEFDFLEDEFEGFENEGGEGFEEMDEYEDYFEEAGDFDSLLDEANTARRPSARPSPAACRRPPGTRYVLSGFRHNHKPAPLPTKFLPSEVQMVWLDVFFVVMARLDRCMPYILSAMLTVLEARATTGTSVDRGLARWA